MIKTANQAFERFKEGIIQARELRPRFTVIGYTYKPTGISTKLTYPFNKAPLEIEKLNSTGLHEAYVLYSY